MEKLKARSARFGSSVAPALTSIDDDAKKKERAKKFGAVPVTSMTMEVLKCIIILYYVDTMLLLCSLESKCDQPSFSS